MIKVVRFFVFSWKEISNLHFETSLCHFSQKWFPKRPFAICLISRSFVLFRALLYSSEQLLFINTCQFCLPPLRAGCLISVVDSRLFLIPRLHSQASLGRKKWKGSDFAFFFLLFLLARGCTSAPTPLVPRCEQGKPRDKDLCIRIAASNFHRIWRLKFCLRNARAPRGELYEWVSSISFSAFALYFAC